MKQSKTATKVLELLAPAGNMSQAIYSIDSGCDAIYGGLANWNARMRASEYKQLLEICRKRNVKFYMTLNTLFKDAELDSVLKIFSDGDFILPDAVIVADIGLMGLLSENFPELDIHASTQYGAYTAADIKFLERYHVTRVILARELTLQEIKKIRAEVNIELEVFVYGSQCVCFSGQCLWSGLTQECSGNRGRCLAPCRDFYRQNHSVGQFLYPQDIDACSVVKELIVAGVNSIKLEGRFRDSVMISSAVKRFRKAIDNLEAKNDKSYLGYLGNEVPVKSMFHVLNPRVSLNQKFATSFGENDFVAMFNQNGAAAITFGTKVDSYESCFYLKTIFHEKLSTDNDSAWASLTFKETVLDKIDVFDNLGRQFAFTLPQQDLIKTTPKNIVTDLKDSLIFKLFEIFSNAPEFSSVKINQSAFKDILRKLNDTCNVVSKPPRDCFVVPTTEDYILLNSYSIMQYLKKIGYRNFIFDMTSVEDSEKIMSENFADDSIIYRLPLFDFADCQKNLLPRLRNKNVMITRLIHLLYKEKYSFKKMFADYTLNIWNSKALSVLKSFGVEMFVAHPELSLAESTSLVKNTNVSLAIVYAGRIPLGYTRACFKEMNLCDGNCRHSVFKLENVTKGYTLQILCNGKLNCRTIFPSTVSIAAAAPNTCKKIYNFSQLNYNEIRALLSGKLNELSQVGTSYGRSVL